jgi:hypothetical protein
MRHSPGALVLAKSDQLLVAAAKEFTSSLTSDAGQSSAWENGTPRQVQSVLVASNILELGGWNPAMALKLEPLV